MTLTPRQQELNAAMEADGYGKLWNDDGTPHYESPLEELTDKVMSTGKGSVTVDGIELTIDYTQ